MEIIEMATMTSKGQVTVPAPIRDIFNLKKSSTVIFKVTDKGIFFMPCEIKEKDATAKRNGGKSNAWSPNAARAIKPLREPAGT